jgi:hypothetical protein
MNYALSFQTCQCHYVDTSQSHVTTDGHLVCLGVKFTLELVTRYYFPSEICCVVSVGRPL